MLPSDFDIESSKNFVSFALALMGAFVAALWLSLIVWTFRDMRARSRDIFTQLLAVLIVTVLSIPGFIVYLILRPRETLAEAYERSLEEEALLQGIEERPFCPGCNRPTRVDWHICPYCQTILKKPCIECNQLLDLTWNVCPFCGVPAPGRETKAAIGGPLSN